MELQQLLYFLKIADYENMTKAAYELKVAQPALSQTMKRLETELGVNLFDRHGKRISLNDNGRVVQKHAKKIFTELDNIHDELADQKNDNQKPVTLAMPVGSLLVTNLIKGFKEKYPNIAIVISQDNEDSDLIISASLYKRPHDKLLCREKIVAALPEDHELAGRAQISLKQLKNDAFISMNKQTILHTCLMHICETCGFKPNIQVLCDNPNTLCELLSLKMGVALIPDTTWPHIEGTVVKPITDSNCYRYIYLKRNENHYASKAILTLEAYIEDYFKNL